MAKVERGLIVPPLPNPKLSFAYRIGGTLADPPRICYGSHLLCVQRELDTPTNILLHFGAHSDECTVMKYNYQGNEVVSGDADGKCFTWSAKKDDVFNKERFDKPCSSVYDIAWGPEKRFGKQEYVLACGAGGSGGDSTAGWVWKKMDGRATFKIEGINKILTCDLHNGMKEVSSTDKKGKTTTKKIFTSRIALGTEDMSLRLYGGKNVDFSYITSNSVHGAFVNCVRFSPDGKFYISVSGRGKKGDTRILLSDSEDGICVPIVDKENGHDSKTSIFEVSWSPDSTKFLTASADKTCKVWDFSGFLAALSSSDKPYQELKTVQPELFKLKKDISKYEAIRKPKKKPSAPSGDATDKEKQRYENSLKHFEEDSKHFEEAQESLKTVKAQYAEAEQKVSTLKDESGVNSIKVVHTFVTKSEEEMKEMSKGLQRQEQQVSCLWLGDYMTSVSLSGRIHYWSLKNNADKASSLPVKIVTGHKHSIKGLATDTTNNYLYTCDTSGRVVRTECKDGEQVDVVGDPHKGTSIEHIAMSCDNKSFFTVGVDDTLFKHFTADCTLSTNGLKLEGAPKVFVPSTVNSLFVVAGLNSKLLFITYNEDPSKEPVVNSIDIDYLPTAAAFSADDKQLIVAGEIMGKNNVRKNGFFIYSIENGNGKELGKFSSEDQLKWGKTTAFAYSPDGKYLVSINNFVWIWELGNNSEFPFGQKDYVPKNKRGFKVDNTGIRSCEWNPNSKYLLTAFQGRYFVWLRITEGHDQKIEAKTMDGFKDIVAMKFLDETRVVGVDQHTIRFFTFKDK